MSPTHTSNEGDDETLGDRLAKDPTGELLGELLAQLATSKAEIEAALDKPRPAEEQDVLQGLQEAVELSESVLRDVWQECHGRAAPC